MFLITSILAKAFINLIDTIFQAWLEPVQLLRNTIPDRLDCFDYADDSRFRFVTFHFQMVSP